MLQGELDRLRRLTEDLTAVSRAEEHQLDLRPRPVDPAALVTRATRAAEPAYTAEVVARGRGNELELAVTDSGEGIPPSCWSGCSSASSGSTRPAAATAAAAGSV